MHWLVSVMSHASYVRKHRVTSQCVCCDLRCDDCDHGLTLDDDEGVVVATR